MYSDCDLSGPSIPKPGNVSRGSGLLKAVQSRERARAGANPSIIRYASAAQSLSSF